MEQLREVATAAVVGEAQRGSNEAILVQGVCDGDGSVANVLALAILCVVAKLTPCDAVLDGLDTAGDAEEGLPEVGDAKDDISADKGPLEAGDILEVGLDELDPKGRELLGRRRVRIASDAANTKAGGQEASGNRATLVAGGTNDTNKLFLLGGHDHLHAQSGA